MTHPPKPLTRLYTTADLGADRTCLLEGGPAHKLRAVLRAKPGDTVALFNGRDGEWRAELSALGKHHAEARCVTQTRPQTDEPGPWLAFAPVKKDRTDMIVEKAVELGVERLLPVLTRRSETRRVKRERLAQTIVDAAEQCERLSVPELDEPVTLEELLRAWPGERRLLVCAERSEARPLARAMGKTRGPLGLLVGPEGGFEAGELDAALNMPISIPVSLGPRILRAETAAIAALAVMQALAGDWTA